MKKITSTLIFIMIVVMVTSAQTEQKEEVSAEELKQFASALQEVQTINQQVQQKMVNAVKEEGLEVQRYKEILQAQQDPNQEANATNEELKQFETAIQEVGELQAKAEQEMEEKIIAEDLTINRYQEIMALIQNDPELQKRIQEYLQG
ncbi:MAG TPA: DUF4168 domain-containing protein [Bacteroidales bacterium]|nr:DUF4168 domain-containing protein [Bacteroidales bacterium]